ncbi:hypothetical protein E3N88_40614 [Mikania micrantha]|uniref:HMA domain-containing protein n=1 Tax=Mikania micrantha TaxID=192012 RepID=A0A5N6LN81_9ASTR|nr:hypothetical protein E3N88_40614 [Mikania micrantha]
MTKPKEEGKKANEEAKEPKEGKKDAISTEKNGTKSNDLPPALSPSQEVVLKVSVHCQGCAERLQKCLKKVTGVEKVIAKCETDKVIVKGNIANPSELVKSVHNEFKWRNVEVIPPPTHEPEKSRKMIKKSEQEEPDNVPVSVITMQCDACAPDTKNNIIKTEVPDQHISQVEIIGTGDDKTGNNTVIVNQDSPQTQGRKIEMTGDDNPTTNVNGPDPGPLEENQWLCALKTFVSFVVYVLFACYLVLMTLGYLGKRVHRMVMQIYDIPVPQSDDRPLPQDSQSPQQSPP